MQVKQDAFDKIKQIVARDTLSAYPFFEETLKSIPMLTRSNYEWL